MPEEMKEERRGLRFSFSADAQVAPENALADLAPGRVTEISFRGCFLETLARFEEQRRVVVKIFNGGEYFESEAAVLYIRPNGIGLEFRETKPALRAVLQRWILDKLHSQP
jgi:PilZ domain-containing protein